MNDNDALIKWRSVILRRNHVHMSLHLLPDAHLAKIHIITIVYSTYDN
jgi:hypothetical protein